MRGCIPIVRSPGAGKYIRKKREEVLAAE